MQICVEMTSPPSPLPPSSPRLLLSWPWSNTSSFTPRALWASLVRAKEKSTCLQALLRMPASTGGRWRHGGTRLDKQTLAPLVSPAVPSLEMSSYSELNHTSSPIAETQERWPYAPTGLFTSLFKQTHFKKTHTFRTLTRTSQTLSHTRECSHCKSLRMSCSGNRVHNAHLFARTSAHPPTHGKQWMRCVKSVICDGKYTHCWPAKRATMLLKQRSWTQPSGETLHDFKKRPINLLTITLILNLNK